MLWLIEHIIRCIMRISRSEVSFMKANIHPEYKEVQVHCACGNTFMAGSTNEEIRVEICSQCHPFYTGKQKLVDTGGRVERFNKRFGRK